MRVRISGVLTYMTSKTALSERTVSEDEPRSCDGVGKWYFHFVSVVVMME